MSNFLDFENKPLLAALALRKSSYQYFAKTTANKRESAIIISIVLVAQW